MYCTYCTNWTYCIYCAGRYSTVPYHSILRTVTPPHALPTRLRLPRPRHGVRWGGGESLMSIFPCWINGIRHAFICTYSYIPVYIYIHIKNVFDQYAVFEYSGYDQIITRNWKSFLKFVCFFTELSSWPDWWPKRCPIMPTQKTHCIQLIRCQCIRCGHCMQCTQCLSYPMYPIADIVY